MKGGVARDVTTSPSGSTPDLMSVALPTLAEASQLGPELARIHSEARRKRARIVRLDLRGAGPLGVAGLQRFVAWLLEIQDLPAAERYVVHLIGDHRDDHQRRGIEALRACDENAVMVSFIEGNA
jgi:hypothetical protein